MRKSSLINNSEHSCLSNSKKFMEEKIAFNRDQTYMVDKPSSLQQKNSSKNECIPFGTNSISEIKKQKRIEMRKTNNVDRNTFGENFKSIETLIKSAKKSGQLNLSNLSINEIPQAVWGIYQADRSPHENGIDVSFENTELKWWNQTELTKFIIASNNLKIIPQNIQKLDSLNYFDIHDNQIESIDDAIEKLSQLRNFNCSHNKLIIIPNGLCNLKQLIELNVSYNHLRELPKLFGHLDALENLNLSNNEIKNVPKSFGWLQNIRKLNLAANSLENVLPEIFFSSSLTSVDLSENQIEKLPKELNELINLEQFYAKKNKIQIFPTFYRCSKLKDLDLSFNQIKEIDDKSFTSLVSLVNFYIRDNKLEILSQTIKHLKNLERIDLSNNNLAGLPNELAEIECLKQLLIDGNPLRTIRRDIINRGTIAILKHLKNQIKPQENKQTFNSENMIFKSEDVFKSGRVYDLSNKKISFITQNMIDHCKHSTACVLNVMKNSLISLPEELGELSHQLNELNISFNLFTSVPFPILKLTNLFYLDLRGNRICDLPNEFIQLKSLRELIISDNKFQEIPESVYQLPILENLFANNNRIKFIDGNKIIDMKFLKSLNLQNNDIDKVPPILGKANQITSLQLEGNPFKIPRTQILAKGTVEILNYLRGRLIETSSF